MRVKTFTAENTAAAMDLVRDELGDKAIIIATRTERNGRACITAAGDPQTEPVSNSKREPQRQETAEAWARKQRQRHETTQKKVTANGQAKGGRRRAD